MIRVALTAVLLALTACSGGDSRPVAETRRTTDAGLALANLHARLDQLVRRTRSGAATPAQGAELVELRLTLGRFAGSIAEYEAADSAAADLLERYPGDTHAHLAVAHVHLTFHRFDAAGSAIERAGQLGADAHAVAALRAVLAQATGRFEEALAVRDAAARDNGNVSAHGVRAALLAEMGRWKEAWTAFEDAHRAYRDVSPLTVAWLELEEARARVDAGQPALARDLLERATVRMPSFAAARVHLAEVEAALGHHERAVVVLEPLAAISDDPDHSAQLARILVESGHAERALSWRAKADAGFRRLIRRHREAFADHAVEFWSGVGARPMRAMRLACFNQRLRPTPRAMELVEAAKAASGRSGCGGAGEKSRRMIEAAG